MTRAPDGRDLDILVTGPESGELLVFHHGTPGAALLPPGSPRRPPTVGCARWS